MKFIVDIDVADEVFHELKSMYRLDLKSELREILLQECIAEVDYFIETGKCHASERDD